MKHLITAIAGSLLVAGCAGIGETPKAATAAQKTATVFLKPTQGNNVTGVVTFTQSGGTVLADAKVNGLTPGSHGFHLHEKGDCSAPDAMSAGGHFNPGGKPHGAATGGERHAGDLGNITADAKGDATLKIEVPGVTLGEGGNSINGKAVVVHAKPDDLKSQPAGDAGPRVACGVVSLK